jgi:hypothetical protein
MEDERRVRYRMADIDVIGALFTAPSTFDVEAVRHQRSQISVSGNKSILGPRNAIRILRLVLYVQILAYLVFSSSVVG